MAALGIALTAALSTGALVLLAVLLRKRLTLAWVWCLGLAVGGALAGLLCVWLERWLWRWTGLDPHDWLENAGGALIAMMVLAVPLEEASKLLVVWPAYQLGRLRDRADGLVAAVAAAAGFAIVEGSAQALSVPAGGVLLARLALGTTAHLLFAGAWGFVLSDATEGRFLRRTWLLAVLFHGLFDHIVFGRGAGTLIVAVPLLIGMLGLAGLGLREARNAASVAPVIATALAEPTFHLIRRVVSHRERPVSLLWIALAAFVNTGVALAAVTLAVYLGHQLGIDFAAADEADVGANAPLLLIGSAVLAAFPLAGYLVARASGTESVLEPAIGAAASIAVVAFLLAMATPVLVVFSLAVAPVAFGLACLGAWFGMGHGA